MTHVLQSHALSPKVEKLPLTAYAALEKRMKQAKLLYSKTIHDFDFTFQPSLSEKQVKETLTCRLISDE